MIHATTLLHSTFEISEDNPPNTNQFHFERHVAPLWEQLLPFVTRTCVSPSHGHVTRTVTWHSPRRSRGSQRYVAWCVTLDRPATSLVSSRHVQLYPCVPLGNGTEIGQMPYRTGQHASWWYFSSVCVYLIHISAGIERRLTSAYPHWRRNTVTRWPRNMNAIS